MCCMGKNLCSLMSARSRPTGADDTCRSPVRYSVRVTLSRPSPLERDTCNLRTHATTLAGEESPTLGLPLVRARSF